MKNLFYFSILLIVACSKQESVEHSDPADNPVRLLVGNWKFFKSVDSKVSGVMDYIMFPELQFKSDLSGVEYANYIYPVSAAEAVKSFSYSLDVTSQGAASSTKIPVLTLKYDDEVQPYNLSFENNAKILILTSKNKVTGSIYSEFYTRLE